MPREVKVWNDNIDDDIRYEIFVKEIENERITKEQLGNFLKDRYDVIRCEVLDIIIDNDVIDEYIEEIEELYRIEKLDYVRCRAFLAISIYKSSSDIDDWLISSVENSIWYDITRAIVSNDVQFLDRIEGYKGSNVASISELSQNLIERFKHKIVKE